MPRAAVHAVVLISFWAGFSGCEPGPETFAARMDAAMATGELSAVLPLLTRRSRAVVQSLTALSKDHAGAGAAAAGDAGGTGARNPFLPVAGGKTQVVSTRLVRSGGREAVILEIRGQGQAGKAVDKADEADEADALRGRARGTSEWVLRQEEGAWRLDLLSTADRRPLR